MRRRRRTLRFDQWMPASTAWRGAMRGRLGLLKRSSVCRLLLPPSRGGDLQRQQRVCVQSLLRKHALHVPLSEPIFFGHESAQDEVAQQTDWPVGHCENETRHHPTVSDPARYPRSKCLAFRVPSTNARIVLHCVVNTIQFRVRIKNGRGDMIERTTRKPLHTQVELDVGNMHFRAADERAIA
jgi:hypothetical protein